MKYRCLFIYQSPNFFGPGFTTIDMTLDEKISSQNIKSVETEGKKVIEADQGCEVSNFFIAAWSEFIDSGGRIIMSWCKRTNYCDYCEIENCELRG